MNERTRIVALIEKCKRSTHTGCSNTLFISGFVYVSNIKEDVALHGQQIAHNTESIKNGKSEMHQITKQINSKLDKIFDMLYELGKN